MRRLAGWLISTLGWALVWVFGLTFQAAFMIGVLTVAWMLLAHWRTAYAAIGCLAAALAAGGITVLKDHLAGLRPSFIAAKARQRTSYLPGEIAQGDWWHTGARVPGAAA